MLNSGKVMHNNVLERARLWQKDCANYVAAYNESMGVEGLPLTEFRVF